MSTVVGACFAVGVFAAASLGYAAGTASPEPATHDVKDEVASTAVVAVSAEGESSVLTDAEEAAYEENITPIDPDEVTFDANEGLSSGEVEERQDGLAENYEVGEPLSPEDLEFLRAYLIEAEPTAESSEPVIEAAAFQGSQGVVAPAALYNLNQSFNVTRSGAGATANAKGSIKGGINLVDASWSVSWTTKRTAGKALTKITSTVTADAFGAVAGWPYVGKIYSKSYSATSPKGASSWSFARSGKVTGAVAYMQMDCKSFVYTSSGSFALP